MCMCERGEFVCESKVAPSLRGCVCVYARERGCVCERVKEVRFCVCVCERERGVGVRERKVCVWLCGV